jgi:putative transposase
LLADITYVETDQGWLNLATDMDYYSRTIVGWTMKIICAPTCRWQR